MFDINTKQSIYSDSKKKTFLKIHELLVTDHETEREKLNDYIKNNPYVESEQDWDDVIESALLQGISISDLLRNPRYSICCLFCYYDSILTNIMHFLSTKYDASKITSELHI